MDGLVDAPALPYCVITWSVNDAEYVSACPRKWINEGRNICKWPKNKKIERKAINLVMNPEEDWTELKDITIVGNYATLVEANEIEKRKTMATSDSEAAALEIQKRRKIKNKKYRDDSISPPPTYKQREFPVPSGAADLDGANKGHVEDDENLTPENVRKAELLNVKPSGAVVLDGANKVNAEIDDTLTQEDLQKAEFNVELSGAVVLDGANKINVEIDDTLTPEDIRRAEFVCEGVVTPLSSGLSSETSSFTARTDFLCQQLSQVMNELKNLKSIVVFTMHRVENIEDILKRVRVPAQCENSPSLLPNFPLVELCQLKSLEEKMASEEFERQLFNMLKYTGGSRERDCVNRCLEKIFTNYLAQFCSWTGKKNNFKLSSLKIMTTLKLAVRESFPNITDDGFERHVMSWFQHAATRLKREN